MLKTANRKFCSGKEIFYKTEEKQLDLKYEESKYLKKKKKKIKNPFTKTSNMKIK